MRIELNLPTEIALRKWICSLICRLCDGVTLKSTFALAAHVVWGAIRPPEKSKKFKIKWDRSEGKGGGQPPKATGGGRFLLPHWLTGSRFPPWCNFGSEYHWLNGGQIQFSIYEFNFDIHKSKPTKPPYDSCSLPVLPNYAKVCPASSSYFLLPRLYFPWVNFNYAHFEPFNVNEKQSGKALGKCGTKQK